MMPKQSRVAPMLSLRACLCAAAACLLVFAFLIKPVEGEAACRNALTAEDPVPAGYGASYNLYSGSRELLVKAACQGESRAVVAGARRSGVYVYQTGYYRMGNRWRTFSFAPTQGSTREGRWIAKEARGLLPASNTATYVAAYVCQRLDGAWRCGCRDRACDASFWQLQRVEETAPSSRSSAQRGAKETQRGEAPDAQCLAQPLAGALGADRMLVGVTPGERSALDEAPYDITYQYLVGIPKEGAGVSSEVSCPVEVEAGTWWGCWQSDKQPPGQFVRDYLEQAEHEGYIPYFTYYVLVYAAGNREGKPVLNLIQDESAMARYFDDWRFALGQVGDTQVILHIEPDFWGFAQLHEGDDPHAIPAAVASANPRDCRNQENSVAGIGRCMVSMARKYAPNALVGLHASSWGTGHAAHSDPGIDVAHEARLVGDFIRESAPDADFIAVEASDHDAATENSWWDEDNRELPHFDRAFRWTRLMAEAAGKPVMWWQLPVGNETLPNEPRSWQDNRVEYFFDHLDEVAATHAVAMLFGAGSPNQTTPATDGGYLASRVREYRDKGGEPLCR